MTASRKDQRRKNRNAVKPTFIISTSPEQTSKPISAAQAIQLDIIARTNFNFFEGKKIADMLKENRRMWHAVLMPLDPISLRDMENGRWHADTLYIYPEDGYQYQLEELVREQFNADEVQWIGGSDAVDLLGTTDVENKSQVILSAWWD